VSRGKRAVVERFANNVDMHVPHLEGQGKLGEGSWATYTILYSLYAQTPDNYGERQPAIMLPKDTPVIPPETNPCPHCQW
jgi:hypothetical protein